MQSINRFLYGPPIEERVKKWQQGLRTEQRRLDREIRQLEGAQTKTRNEIKQLAKKGDTKNAKILAREVVRSNKQKNRIHTSKARLNSVGMQLQHQMGGFARLAVPGLLFCLGATESYPGGLLQLL